MPGLDLTAVLTEASRTMNRAATLEETLDEVVRVARETVPGFDHVGISTLDGRDSIQTRAATGDLVWEVDKIQYSLGEGPCVDALRVSQVVVVPSIRHDQRWPRYVPEAVRAGLRSQLAVRLFLDETGTMGNINFYSTLQDAVDPEAPELAGMFATHAAVALGHVHERDHLKQALASRKVIGQALGLLMERYHLDEDRAFAFLVRASSQGNVKLRVIAQELVDRANEV